MNFKRFSPAIILSLILIAPLLDSAKLQAGASNKNGNPFGNGTFFPDSGTFSAIIRGTNGFLGVVQFTTTAAGSSTNTTTATTAGAAAATAAATTASTANVATIYAEGEQFIGTAAGSVSGSTIAATYGASYAYNLLLPSNSIATVTNGTIITTTTNTTFAAQAVTNNINGQINGTLYNTYPTQSFSGSGVSDVILTKVDQTNFIVTFKEAIYQNTVTGTRLVQ